MKSGEDRRTSYMIMKTQMWRKMDTEIQVELIHKETVTPSSPTLHHLATSKLSVFDQLMSDSYVRLLLFYPSNNEVTDADHRHSLVTERSKLLKTSLSEILSHFYPFAGRISIQNNTVSICCNDQGAAFIEARVNCPISNVLEKPDFQVLKQFLPTTMESSSENTGYLLLVQANFFECGGLALGVSISHKAADASTFGKFISSWAAVALGADARSLPTAEFDVAASTYPQLDFLNNTFPQPADSVPVVCKARRFVFGASEIALLKSKAASATIPDPTRVEVVSAFIWKCAMESSRLRSGSTRPSVLCQWANMRKVLGKPDLMGNLLGHFTAKTKKTEEDLQFLVTKLREGNEEFKKKYGNGVSSVGVCELYNEFYKLLLLGKVGISDIYNCSSWCRFPFYDANFGWGKPSWVTTPIIEVKNFIVLLDTRDGNGIEVYLSCKEDEMALIETNEELLAYASLNPNAI